MAIDYDAILKKAQDGAKAKIGNLPMNQQYGPANTFSSLYGGSNKKPIDTFPSGQLNINKPFNVPEERYSRIPNNYSFEKGTDLSRFSNLPESVGYGQYAQDPSQSDTLLKSTRELVDPYDPFVNAYLLGGLPSSTYQIDHIFPFWAGGTGELANKQVLSNKDHDVKTKVGAVARTLYYAEEIELGEARAMLMNWKDKDINGIEIDDKGYLVGSINTANKKVKEWAEPKKVTFKDWLKETPESIEKIASKTVPTPLWDFWKNAASAFTGGWYKPGKTDYSKWEEARGNIPLSEFEKKTSGVAEFGGQLTGTLASFVGLKAALSGAAKVTGLGNLFKGSSFATKLSQAPKIGAGNITVSSQKAARVLENMGLFGVHGQLSRQEEEAVGGRMTRLATDLAMGSLLGSAGQTLKGYRNIGAGTFLLSTFQGADPKDSFINSLVVMGLHGMGYKGRIKPGDIDRMATEAALKQRQMLLNPKKKISLKLPEKKSLPTFEKIQEENTQIAKILQKKVKDGKISYQEAQAEMGKTVMSSRQLYKGGLGKEARLREEVKDMFSITKAIKETIIV